MMTNIGDTAPITQFRSPLPQILYGERLEDVQNIAQSIREFGLISPLEVTRTDKHLLVIDGRKRLAALRRLDVWNLRDDAKIYSITFLTSRFRMPRRNMILHSLITFMRPPSPWPWAFIRRWRVRPRYKQHNLTETVLSSVER